MLTIPSSESSWFFGSSFMLNKLAMLVNELDISRYNELLLNKVMLIEDRLILKKDNFETNKSQDFILWDIKTGIEYGFEVTGLGIVDHSKSFYDKGNKEDRDSKYTNREIKHMYSRIGAYLEKMVEPVNLLDSITDTVIN